MSVVIAITKVNMLLKITVNCCGDQEDVKFNEKSSSLNELLITQLQSQKYLSSNLNSTIISSWIMCKMQIIAHLS